MKLVKASKDSTHSSKPPSSDLTQPEPKHTKPGRPKRRTPGAQPGHEKKQRPLLPEDKVDEVVVHELPEEEVRRRAWVASERFERTEPVELRPSPLYVTEHRVRVYHDAQGHAHIRVVEE
ncbi:MAG: hypothetical protein GKR94_02900 [Gammaproteobacteria bacterium]|nr:hypothetical protein [Gammaproteobacteria bacterium]